MGALARRITRSTSVACPGSRRFACRKKNGSARSTPTMTGSRNRRKKFTGLRDLDFLQQIEVVERLAASEHHGADRVVADHDGQARLLAQEHVEVAQERASAREHDALVDDVRRELRR